jgi:hypothetical protein
MNYCVMVTVKYNNNSNHEKRLKYFSFLTRLWKQLLKFVIFINDNEINMVI